VKKLVQIR